MLNNHNNVNDKKGTMNNKPKRGFAAMSEAKLKEIAHKGGKARSEQLGTKGYSEIGKKGGLARAEQLGPQGYSEIGKKGGQTRAEQLGSLGFAKLGKKGSERLWGKRKLLKQNQKEPNNKPNNKHE